MASDNLLTATSRMRNAVTGLKKRLSDLKIEIESFDAEIEKIDARFDNLVNQADIYKSKLERELGREVRRLQKELERATKTQSMSSNEVSVNDKDLIVASTVAIIESLLGLISENASDFRLLSQSFLFPAVIERVMSGGDDAYFLEEVPASASIIVGRGRAHVQWLREEYDTHLTEPETWKQASGYVVEWWRNDALPLLYGARDEQWDIDVPLSLQEMLTWRDSPADRPMMLPSVFDAYEVCKRNKDAIYEKTGLRQFELRQFTFAQ